MSAPTLPLPPTGAATRNKILLLGLGNDILGDDAVGLNIAREIRPRLSQEDGIEVQETSEMGLSLLDYIVGFDDLVLVDAVQTGQVPPGFVHELDGDDLQVLPRGSPHFLGVGEMLALGRHLGLSVPPRVKLFGVEVEDPSTVTTTMTTALRQAFPAVVDRILRSTRALLNAVCVS